MLLIETMNTLLSFVLLQGSVRPEFLFIQSLSTDNISMRGRGTTSNALVLIQSNTSLKHCCLPVRIKKCLAVIGRSRRWFWEDIMSEKLCLGLCTLDLLRLTRGWGTGTYTKSGLVVNVTVPLANDRVGVRQVRTCVDQKLSGDDYDPWAPLPSLQTDVTVG